MPLLLSKGLLLDQLIKKIDHNFHIKHFLLAIVFPIFYQSFHQAPFYQCRALYYVIHHGLMRVASFTQTQMKCFTLYK